jgi:hypothetical protein
MLIFIDESGDPGFKLEKGASPIFVAAMVMFSTTGDATLTQAAIEKGKARQAHKREFKFNKCSHKVRDDFSMMSRTVRSACGQSSSERRSFIQRY